MTNEIVTLLADDEMMSTRLEAARAGDRGAMFDCHDVATATAKTILATCAMQDMVQNGREAVIDFPYAQAVRNWRQYSAEAGDAKIVAAIDHLGERRAENAYELAVLKAAP